MDNSQWILTLMLLLGLLGTIVPLIPGMSLIFVALLVYSWFDGWQTFSWLYLAFVGFLTTVCSLVSYGTSVIGAKKFGVSTKGLIGALVGGVIGMLIFSVPGMAVGAVLGAIIAELWLQKRTLTESMTVAAGVFLGIAAGTALQFMVALAVVAYSIVKLL